MSKKEGRYYVEYLGWKESHGLFGREFTEPVIKELLARRRNAELPRMTIKLSNNEILISQESIKKSGSKREKTKYPGIPAKDASFVIQGFYPDTDVVACVFLGYNPYTKCAIHVHVYRFDSENTARVFVNHLSSIIDKPEFRSRILSIEKDLAEIGHIAIRHQRDDSTRISRHNSSGSDGLSHGTQSPQSGESMSPSYPTADEALRQRQDIRIQRAPKQVEPDKKVKKIFSSLHEELEYKMSVDDAPILLPPKDYDTIVRRHGRLDFRDDMKARTVVGPNGIFSHLDAQAFNGPIDDGSSQDSERTQGSNGSDTPKNSDSSTKKIRQQNGESHILTRSQSDTFNYSSKTSSLHRQHSLASSDRSNNSDDFFADGVYQGYHPRGHVRSRSKDNGNFQLDESATQMAMWSPTYSFGQTGMKHLPIHEEEPDFLNRTAPAGMLGRDKLAIPPADYGSYQITRTSGPVHRSHSDKQKGENARRKHR